MVIDAEVAGIGLAAVAENGHLSKLAESGILRNRTVVPAWDKSPNARLKDCYPFAVNAWICVGLPVNAVIVKALDKSVVINPTIVLILRAHRIAEVSTNAQKTIW
jgi:hypothetical protein